MMSKTYEQTIEEIKQEYRFHKGEADKFEKLLIAAGIAFNSNGHSNGNGHIQKNIISPETATRQTFESVIIHILTEKDTPINTKDLHDEYERITGHIIISKNFSSKLSIVASSKGTIKNQYFRKYQEGYKYWWCKAEWFDGEKLKESYKQKVVDKMKVLQGNGLFRGIIKTDQG